MSEDTGKAGEAAEQAPDLVRHYRPVGIRSVVAAQAMIPRYKPAAPEHEPMPEMGFSLPTGFYTVPED